MADEPTRWERRSTPRISLEEPVACGTRVQSRVRVLEVSLTGMLLASDVALPPGTRMHLRTFLDGRGFAADVQVQRTTRSERSAAESSVAFVWMDGESQQNLEQFLRRA